MVYLDQGEFQFGLASYRDLCDDETELGRSVFTPSYPFSSRQSHESHFFLFCTGVVDSHLRVYGTSNLRIVDASIMPLQISGHLSSTLYAVAEKAADIIKTDNGQTTSPPQSGGGGTAASTGGGSGGSGGNGGADGSASGKPNGGVSGRTVGWMTLAIGTAGATGLTNLVLLGI